MAITEKQAADRRKGIGSSDAAAVLGLHPFRTPLDVWLDKTDKIDGFQGNEATRRGDLLEPVILKMTEDEIGSPIRAPKQTFVKGVLRGNIDGMVDKFCKGGIIVEAKSSLHPVGWGEPGSDIIPQHVLIQVMHQMICADSDEAIVSKLGAFFDLSIYHAYYDLDAAEKIEEYCERWWRDYVVADVEPEVTKYTDDVKEYFGSMSRDNDLVVNLDQKLAEDYAKAKADLKEATDRESLLKARMLQAIGEGTKGVAFGYEIKVNNVRGREGVDKKLLKMRHPDVYEEVKKLGNPHVRATFKATTEAASE